MPFKRMRSYTGSALSTAKQLYRRNTNLTPAHTAADIELAIKKCRASAGINGVFMVGMDLFIFINAHQSSLFQLLICTIIMLAFAIRLTIDIFIITKAKEQLAAGHFTDKFDDGADNDE